MDQYADVIAAILVAALGLEGLTNIAGSLIFSSNGVLASLQGLDRLRTVGGDVVIQGNRLLTKLQELEGLTNIIGLHILSNYAMTSLQGCC